MTILSDLYLRVIYWHSLATGSSHVCPHVVLTPVVFKIVVASCLELLVLMWIDNLNIRSVLFPVYCFVDPALFSVWDEIVQPRNIFKYKIILLFLCNFPSPCSIPKHCRYKFHGFKIVIVHLLQFFMNSDKSFRIDGLWSLFVARSVSAGQKNQHQHHKTYIECYCYIWWVYKQIRKVTSCLND